MTQKQTVLIFGATGRTGVSLVNGLIDSHKFNVVAAIRPASKDKPEVAKLKSRGVEVRLVDILTIDDSTVDVLRGVDIVISATDHTTISAQKQLVDAAKKAGVKRLIPNDWGTPCVRGVRQYYDDKGVIQDYIREQGIGYTFIDVGIFPPVAKAQEFFPGHIESFARILGGGDVKNAFTDIDDIGTFVARIIRDPRTLNQYVFIWGEEATKRQALDIAEKVRGIKIETTIVSPAEAEKQLASARAAGGLPQIVTGYEYSFWVRGDNVVENAKKPEYGGALDARELYHDIQPRALIDFARSFEGICNIRSNRFNSLVDHLKDMDATKLWIQRSGNSPQLEEFGSFIHRNRNSPNDEIPLPLSSFTRLKSLHLSNTPLHINFVGQIHSIQQINVWPTQKGILSLADVVQCLTTCPNLTSLELSLQEPSQTTLLRDIPADIKHSYLRSLTLSMSPDSDPHALFDRLLLPALRRLDLAMSGSDKSDWPHLILMLSRSRPPLVSLHIHQVPMTELTLLECLSYAPTLIALTIDLIYCTGVTLASLTVDVTGANGRNVLCPLLKDVDFGFASQFTPDAMKQMILSRWPDSDQQNTFTHVGNKLRKLACFPFEWNSIRRDKDISRCFKNGLFFREYDSS
ncbi:NAD(P)-binding protein [Rickenella mellea]|uniref:NAD(P)-binding protein n=1 Tax=Rickenella mellea TaxID=50990 RepID=A0A4Y7PXR0_9AGAM|nr:NAD(P)-binding protein [Rickenella mellea]